MIGDADAHSTPQEVFLLAQQSVREGDWEAFFPLLVRNDLERLAELGVASICGSDGSLFRELCQQHGIPDTDLDHLEHIAGQVAASATTILHAVDLATEETMLRSMAHRELVRSQTAALAMCVQTLTALAPFVAATERLRREREGGGSVSSTMFLDETLLNVVVNGNRALGTRRRTRGSDEPIAFERRRGTWQIVLFGRS